MSGTEQTPDEVIDSLTGHDELAISQHFGETIGELVRNQSMLRRVCVFVLKRREGLNDDDARNFAMDLPLGQAFAWFGQESDDSGKDETEPEPRPSSSPDGVSGPVELVRSS